MTADLHIHSNHSDGSASVKDIVDYAVRMGLSAIAITDHDTMAGVERAAYYGKMAGIQVIPGIEITTRDNLRGRPVHLLCYLPQQPELLQSFCDVTLANRTNQKRQMAEKIAALYPVTLEDILRRSVQSEAIYECHIMAALADMGYTNTVIGPLMDELISSNGRCYVPSSYPDVRDALQVVRACGGISVIAHPGQFDSLALIEELAHQKDLDGVELWHPRNSPPVMEALESLAVTYGLITTGGSDFHGSYAKNPHPIGFCRCGADAVNALLVR